jgi:hypothetical protein
LKPTNKEEIKRAIRKNMIALGKAKPPEIFIELSELAELAESATAEVMSFKMRAGLELLIISSVT